MSDNSVLGYAISSKPCVELGYAQEPFNASANMNWRNLSACTAAHDVAKVCQSDRKTRRAVTDMLEWLIDHGGDVGIADSNGMIDRSITTICSQSLVSELREGCSGFLPTGVRAPLHHQGE